jgi:hypothetical protein
MVDNPGLIKTPEVETLPFVGSVSKLRTFGRSADYGAVAHAGARGWSSPPPRTERCLAKSVTKETG